MKIHRFFVGGMHDKNGEINLDQQLWIHDNQLINQWVKVLRLKVGERLMLFNGNKDNIYTITKIEYPHSVLLDCVTESVRQLPSKHIYLFWSLLKKNNNEWILQKATELGVRNFVPIIADRSEKTALDTDRAGKIIIEACEQCGRSDIPDIREPISIMAAVDEYRDMVSLFIGECGENYIKKEHISKKMGVLIGPEGGWSDAEKQLFAVNNIPHINLSQFTLRAETAAIVATAELLRL